MMQNSALQTSLDVFIGIFVTMRQYLVENDLVTQSSASMCCCADQ